ncbi:MAG: serine--tRNA ligase [Bdellovibrionales bacterium]
MIDIEIIRRTPDALDEALKKRGQAPVAKELQKLDEDRRAVQTKQQETQAKRNALSAQIGELKKNKQNADDLMAEVARLKADLEALGADEERLGADLHDRLARLPNIVDADVLAGDKEANVVIETFGKKPEFDFAPKDHYELVTSLKMVDFDRGVKLGGSGFWAYTNIGAQLEWALLNFFVAERMANGYQFILPPHILTYESGYTAGQFPKFEEDVFVLKDRTSEDRMRFLMPTAETALINWYRDEILDEAQLPTKLFAYSPCYRREAGGARASERGTVRGHQFNKVEMFQFTTAEQSDAAHEEMIKQAADTVRKLGLHFQISKLSAGDTSAGMARTYDIEAWIPSTGEYKEVSSASNAREFQARRGNMRYRPKGEKNTRFIHTLNASGLATSRLVPAIVETYQQKDGSVLIPDVLQPYMNGLKVIRAE